jgi:hypothetical protein
METTNAKGTFFIRVGEHEFRAPDMPTLRQWASEGRIPPESYVFHPSLQRWLHAREIAELAPFYSHSPSIAALASNYRQLVLWVGAQIVLSIGVLIFPLLAFFVFVTVLAIAFFAYRTAESLGSSSAVLWAAAMLIPILNVLFLVALSSRASSVCAANGIPVGLLGPRQSR